MNQFADFTDHELQVTYNAYMREITFARDMVKAIEHFDPVTMGYVTDAQTLSAKLGFQLQAKTLTELIAEIDALTAYRKHQSRVG